MVWMSIPKASLQRGLSTVSRAVATKSVQPIIQCALLTVDDDGARLTATDYEYTITAQLEDVAIQSAGRAVVPHKLLSDLVKMMPDGENILLSAEERQRVLTVTDRTQRSMAHINLMSVDDFPDTKRSYGDSWQLSQAVFCDAIEHVEFAAATSDSRPVLTGVHVVISGDAFTFAAVDGFRMSVYDGKLVEAGSDDVDIIVPVRIMRDMHRFAREQSSPVLMSLSDDGAQVKFVFDGVCVTAQLLQGIFPEYRNLIPEDAEVGVVVDGAELLRAVRTAQVFTQVNADYIRLRSNGYEMRVYTSVMLVGDYSTVIDVTPSLASGRGGSLRVALNNQYLRDVVSVLSDGDMALELSDKNICMIYPIANSVRGSDYKHVLMPVAVKWDEEEECNDGGE